MHKYFTLDSSPLFKDKYIIRLNHSDLPFPNGTKGSYDVLIARILNLSYTDYLRYTRDRLGAELIGKKSRYIKVYFDNTETVHMFIKLLNKRIEYLMNEQEHPYTIIDDGENVEILPFAQEV